MNMPCFPEIVPRIRRLKSCLVSLAPQLVGCTAAYSAKRQLIKEDDRQSFRRLVRLG